MGARFFTSIWIGPGAHPASYTMGTGSFLGVKQPGHGVDHPPPSSLFCFCLQGKHLACVFRNKGFFYGEELLAPHPTPKLEDHPVSAVRDCLFNIFAATLLIGGRTSIRNPRTHHAMVTGTHLSHGTPI